MVKQTITYSDGTETVINYRGKIVDGQLINEEVSPEVVETKVTETINTPNVEKNTEEVKEIS